VLVESKGDWAETTFRQLVRSFGCRLNSLPFELLGKSVTYKILRRHIKNIDQLEALLFGQAGFLEDHDKDPYRDHLHIEYTYLAGKYKLRAINGSLWKFLRLRPANFPTIRLAQLSGLFFAHPGIIGLLHEVRSLKDAESLLEASASPDSEKHYHFGKQSDWCDKSIGEDLRQTIIINAIVPLQFVHAFRTGDNRCRNLSLALLEALPAEKNSIISSWKSCGITASNALYSQALLHLKNNYCNFRRC
jgi:hypothetical protein